MMKNTMRNTMKRNTLSILLIVLLALSAMQASAVDYRNSYRGIQNSDYRVQTISVTAPVATFQSTSVYAPSEWTEKPMLNSDGTVNEGAYMGGPRRLGGSTPTPTPGGGGNGPGTPGNPDDEDQQPLGDALIPLFLLALAYAIYKVSRRRKEATDN